MSSRLHNKWHRHNHHTNPTNNTDLPDSGHDPIASPESPFQGAFALNGTLSASQSGRFAGDVALTLQSQNLGLSTNGGMSVNGTAFIDTLDIRSFRVVTPSTSFNSVVTHSGKYLEINVDGQNFYVPLWTRP
jgi:hypothetical protein